MSRKSCQRTFLFFLVYLQSKMFIESWAISRKIADNNVTFTICHRKLQPGKKMMDLHVERIVPCENVQDCRWACDYEKTFICNGYNYRRETNGSKDTCELVSTPYYRTNVNRDFLTDSHYDYYERDRNCFSPMNGGDGASWTDRAKTDQPNRPDSFALLDREDRDFVSRGFSGGQVRTNKRFPFETSRDFAPRYYPAEAWSNDPRKDSNIVGNDPRRGPRINYDDELYSLTSKSQLEDRSHKFFNPEENEHFYGKFYNYGGAFGYNDDNRAPTTKEFPFAEREKSSESSKCSILLTSGSKLSRSVLRKTCLVRDLKECEDSCINESSFPCESFAYRYNVLTTNPTDNCLLSELPYEHFNFYTDLEPDRDYDSYVLSQDSNICRSKEEATKRYPSEECFSRVRSGFGIPTDVTKASMQASDLGGCQYACATSRQFVCRSFAFKYATERRDDRDRERGTPNCFLTDWSSEEMNPVNMLDMDGAELYERNSSPYGCEAYPLTVAHKQLASTNADETCYAQHHGSCKLLPHAIVSSTQALTKSECCRKCSNMRNVGWTPCMSFNYVINVDNMRDNCWLSNIPARDLRPHLDYVYDEEHALYTWKDLDPYCSLTVNPLGSNEHDQPSFPPAFVQPHAERVPADQPIFDSHHTTRNRFRPGDHEQQDYERNRETDSVDAGPDYLPREIGYHYPKDRSIFRRYTVNGYPCRNGSVCQRNEIAGFWSCETEGSERGSWDYCCEPNHRCGFSQGYRYPWCYVGPNDEQWRPCSETYYPHYATKDHRPFHSQPPTSVARHWPVIYLHDTLPPNCTVDNHFDKHYFNEDHRRDSA